MDIVIPGSIDAGRIEQRFKKAPEPKSRPDIVTPQKVEQVAPEQAEQIRFDLVGITLQGNTVYDDLSLLPLWEQLLGQEVSLTQVYEIADAITAYYRNAGYILTQAIVPPQKVNNGVVIIKVVEGYADDVLIEGDVQWRSGLFHAWAKKIKESKPLNNALLERYTLLASDISGLRMKAVIRPSLITSGASDVVLIIERTPLDASLSYDNLGTRSIGTRQVTANLGVNSIFKLLERTSITYLTTDDGEELNYYGFQHDHILSSEGLTLSLNGNISYSEPGENLSPLKIEGDNKTFNVEFAYPILRSRNTNLSVSAGLTARNSKTDMQDQLLSEDRVRILKIGVNYDFADRLQAVNLINVMYFAGLDILNATETGSDNLTRADGHSEFHKVTFDLSRRQPLPYNLSLLLAATGQWSDVSLLSSEEFGYGGSQYGRAYNSSSITGDKGIAAKAELQYTDYFGAQNSHYYQIYTFYDAGKTDSNSSLKDDNDDGYSVGGGVRLGIGQHFSGYLEVAQPLTAHISEQNGRNDYARVFFNISARY